MSRNASRIALLLVAAVSAIALVTFAVLGDDSKRDASSPVVTITPEAPLIDEEVPAEVDNSELEEDLAVTYLRCAEDAGFDPEFAQVITDRGGTPMTVKTGVDVPSSIHRPCFMAIGGEDPRRSSYGTYDTD